MIKNGATPSAAMTGALDEVFRLKTADGIGWSPRMRQRFQYFTPDEWYEAVMLRLVDGGTDWLDVGCGRELFPSNMPLARMLSSRCRRLVGIDPDANIQRNELLHERVKSSLEGYRTSRQFDVVSLRMVVEHIACPEAALAGLGRLTRFGGRVVVFTVSKWSPASLAAAVTPMALHHVIKRALWRTDPDDTFPTIYRMNCRRELDRLFTNEGFVEEEFFLLNDCRSFARWRPTAAIELAAERGCRMLGIAYPEVCLLGVYRKDRERRIVDEGNSGRVSRGNGGVEHRRCDADTHSHGATNV